VEETPEGRNPRSETCPKMAGREREEEAAERLRKPASGTVVGRVGPADTIPAKRPGRPKGNRRTVDSFLLMRCRGKEPQERLFTHREVVDGIFENKP